MDLDRFANLAEIIGVILVVASLIYVAKQLRQNTDAVRAQSRQTVLTAAQYELFAQVEHPDLVTRLVDPKDLTPEEQVKLSSWFFAIFRAREFAWLQHRNGVIDDTQWQTEMSVIRFFLDNQRFRHWWNKIGGVAFGDEYADFVNDLIEDQPATDSTFKATTDWVVSTHSE